MLVIPHKALCELYPELDTAGMSVEDLADIAKDQRQFEIMAYASDVDPRRTAFMGHEISAYVLYANIRKLLRRPTCGQMDMKTRFCTIYSSPSTMKTFFSGDGLSMLNLRLLMEISLLYNLSPDEFSLMTQFLCSFKTQDSSESPSMDYLRNIYSKKDVAKHITAIASQRNIDFLPTRLTKGMEYPSYEDFVHAFQAMGINPFDALTFFASRNVKALLAAPEGELNRHAFDIPELFAVEEVPPADSSSEDDDTDSPEDDGMTIGNVNMPNTGADCNSKDCEAPSASPTVDKMEVADGCHDVDSPADDDYKAFGQLLYNATYPIRCQRAVYLPRNVYVLMDGSDTNQGHNDLIPQALINEKPSNIDVFNWLCNMSMSYGVPMSVLLFSPIFENEYTLMPAISSKSYTEAELSTALSCQITDENLFDQICHLVQEKGRHILNQFGYIPSAYVATVPPASPVSTVTNCEDNEKKEEDLPMKEKNGLDGMNLDLKLRLCKPCDTDSWENDNPNRDEPGFHWADAEQELLEQASAALSATVADGGFSPSDMRKSLNDLLNMPFRARAVVSSKGFRMTIDLY